MPSEVHSGGLSILLTGSLIVVALVYLRGWYQLRNALPNVLFGVAPYGVYVWTVLAVDRDRFSSRDSGPSTPSLPIWRSTLLLMTVAAPLILLGAPVIALLQRLPPRFRRSVVAPLLRCPHPAFCWLASTVTVIGWHVPALFELGMRSEVWHEIEHGSFFCGRSSVLVARCTTLAEPRQINLRWSVPVYLFLATLPCDVLSAFLTFCNGVVYPHYLSAHRLFDISPLGDQERAGALMWVSVTFAYLVPAAVVTIQMLFRRRRRCFEGRGRLNLAAVPGAQSTPPVR